MNRTEQDPRDVDMIQCFACGCELEDGGHAVVIHERHTHLLVTSRACTPCRDSLPDID